MSKKKSKSIMKKMDKNLRSTYKKLERDCDTIQKILYKEDKKVKKKAKKKAKGDKEVFNELYAEGKEKNRKKLKASTELETTFTGEVEALIDQIVPAVIVVSRSVASIILSILSIDYVQTHISKETYDKLKAIYNASMNI